MTTWMEHEGRRTSGLKAPKSKEAPESHRIPHLQPPPNKPHDNSGASWTRMLQDMYGACNCEAVNLGFIVLATPLVSLAKILHLVLYSPNYCTTVKPPVPP